MPSVINTILANRVFDESLVKFYYCFFPTSTSIDYPTIPTILYYPEYRWERQMIWDNLLSMSLRLFYLLECFETFRWILVSNCFAQSTVWVVIGDIPVDCYSHHLAHIISWSWHLHLKWPILNVSQVPLSVVGMLKTFWCILV